MAKINHLDMGAEVLALEDVQVKKGFMGLTIKLIYKPTNSAIKIKEKEYSACLSDDHQFVATQLLAFKGFGYQPVTEMVTYTGKTAEAFAQLF